MQYKDDIRIKKWNPRILLNSLKESFLAWIGISGSQLTLNDVTFSNVKTIKKTIGGIGVSGCDFNFVSAANMNEQVIDFGAIIPANARVLDVRSITNSQFTGAVTLVAEAGNTSSGNQFISSATIYAANAITSMANAGVFSVAPNAAEQHVYVAATPGANWSNITAGKVTYFITYIEAI